MCAYFGRNNGRGFLEAQDYVRLRRRREGLAASRQVSLLIGRPCYYEPTVTMCLQSQ